MGRRQFVVLTGCLLVGGCAGEAKEGHHVVVWGREGRGDGAFVHPRAISTRGDAVYVIDKSGRVQVFDKEGTFQHLWELPAWDNGTPTAITFRPDDTVVIPDTHYSRILEYTPEGTLIDQWGDYGAEPGHFIYPTGLALDPDGVHFISEYGSDFNPQTRIEAERVQVFDAARHFVRQWGKHGDQPGEFSRAMAIAITPDNVLVVADTANHRLQCFSRDGAHVRDIGGAGKEPGKLDFPHDLCVAPDGTVLVAEYGAHRISRFAVDGTFVGSYGTPGRAPGEFNAPRGVCADAGGNVFVADTDNHRVQRIPLEAIS